MNTRKYSKAQESRVAKALKGKRQVNSGATKFHKGDVLCSNFCIECKTSTTEKASVSIKKEWLEKLREEAFAMNKQYSALCFNFGSSNPLQNCENFYIIDERLFKQLQTYIEENN